MPLASTSQVQVKYKPEVTFGTIDPTGGNNVYDLRVTGESLSYAINKEMSQEINAYRAASSSIPVSASASGDIQAEMCFGEYDRLLIAALQDDPATYVKHGTNGVGTSFAATFTTTTLTAGAAPTGTSAFTTLQPGQFFQVVDALAASPFHLKVFRNSKTVAATSTVITFDTGTPASAGTIAGCTLRTARYSNGTTQKSFSIEKWMGDITQFLAYKGMTVASYNLSIANGSLTTHSFSFMGTSVVRAATTSIAGTQVTSGSYDTHSGVSGRQCELWIGGVPLTGTYVKSLSWDYSNTLREQSAICSLPVVGLASGQIESSLTMSVYFANGTLYDSFLANDYLEVCFSTLDSSNQGYIVTLPRCNITSAEITAGGKDSDMMVEITMSCLRDAANATAGLRKVAFIDRVGPAVTAV